MKKPKLIPLTDSPRCKEVSKIPLSENIPEPEEYKTFWKTYTTESNNEDYQQNNSEGIQQLESDSTD